MTLSNQREVRGVGQLVAKYCSSLPPFYITMSRVLAVCLCVCFVAVSCRAGSMKPMREHITFFSEPPQANALTQLQASKQNSAIANRPYVVSMRMSYDSTNCEAAVLRSHWAITSADCCVRRCGRPYTLDASQRVTIRSGSNNYNSGGTEHEVESIVLPPEGYLLFSAPVANNLCLVKVKQAFTFGNEMEALRLAGSEDYGDNQYYGMISGWSTSTKDALPSNPLKTVTLPLISNNSCKQKYSPASDITDKLICAVTAEQQTCHGMAGGPLVVDGVLVGVVSTGFGCDNKPGVYTRISQYSTWIRDNIGDDDVEAEPDLEIEERTLP